MGNMISLHDASRTLPHYSRFEVSVGDCRNDYGSGFVAPQIQMGNTEVTFYCHNDGQRGIFIEKLEELIAQLKSMPIDEANEYTCDCCI